MHIQFPEDLCGIKKVIVVENPRILSACSWPLRYAISSHFFALNATRGRFRSRAIQYPFIRKRNVRKAWTAASGMM